MADVDDRVFETSGGYETVGERTTPTELRATLVTLVAGATETHPARWEKLIGEVDYLSLALHPRSNWRVDVKGSDDDRRVLHAAIDLLRGEHPNVTREKSSGG